ncbi:MAG: hypothetical protein JXA79_06710, partial [Deltaproteobacteria bacterium]|nr:hypothetical protein [Deltaproteobacteria bacterium]
DNDYQAIRGLLVYHFLRAETVSVFIRSVKIEVKQDTAAVKAKVILSRGKKVKHIEDLLPESAGLFIFEVTFTKEKDKWMVIEANWHQTGWEDIFSPEVE